MSKTSRPRISGQVIIAIISTIGIVIAAFFSSPYIVDVFKKTPTETQAPPIPTSTIALTSTSLPPTLTPLPTNTITPTATPIPGDFEASDEGWGNYPENGLPKPGEYVSRYCDSALPIHHTGNCSLKYQPLQIKNGSAYVARFSTADDVKSLISIWVYVPSSELCLGNKCSTARVIVWDNNYQSHEGEFVGLNRLGEWVEIKLDLSGTNYPQPYQAIGVHFYLSTQYEGPFYIDSVTITRLK